MLMVLSRGCKKIKRCASKKKAMCAAFFLGKNKSIKTKNNTKQLLKKRNACVVFQV